MRCDQAPLRKICDPARYPGADFEGEHVQGPILSHPEEAVSLEVLGDASDGF